VRRDGYLQTDKKRMRQIAIYLNLSLFSVKFDEFDENLRLNLKGFAK